MEHAQGAGGQALPTRASGEVPGVLSGTPDSALPQEKTEGGVSDGSVQNAAAEEPVGNSAGQVDDDGAAGEGESLPTGASAAEPAVAQESEAATSAPTQPAAVVSDSPVASTGHDVAPEPDRFGTTDSLMRAALGQYIPTGPLGPDTVPIALLDLALSLAISDAISHMKHCRNLNCDHLPVHLRMYRRGMRPDAIRKARDPMYRALWNEPDCFLVKRIKKTILAAHKDVSEAIAAGVLRDEQRLSDVLERLPDSPIRVLAAVLWARDFDGPAAQETFRRLVALEQALGAPGRLAGRQSEGRQIRDLNDRVRDETKLRKEAQRKLEELKRSIQPKDQAREKAAREIEVARRARDAAIRELEQANAQLALLRVANDELERTAKTSTTTSMSLRKEIQQLQKALRAVEADRSGLAMEVASSRRMIEQQRLKLESILTGAEAVWQFIKAEEKRIDQNRLIVSGGDRLRADAEWTLHGKLERAFLDAYPTYREPRPVIIPRKSSLKFEALGGAGEVGRSCYLLEIAGRRILVDCGIKTGAVEAHPLIERLDHIDALVLTHAHTDHIGWVPALVKALGEFEIYCSEGTAALLPVMLDDCHNHYRRRLAGQQERAKFIRNAEPEVEAYTGDEVALIPKLVITCPFEVPEPLTFGDVSLQFFKAGHILGAASVLVQDGSGRKIFLSGDFSSFEQLTVPSARWPNELGEIDLLVLESTYGKRDQHPSLADSRQELVDFVRDVTERRSGSVILASFALGRAQELIQLIVGARRSGALDRSVPMFVDGMIRQINPAYRKLSSFDVEQSDVIEVSGESDRDDICIEAQKNPAIIVTTSGMLNGGPVVEYSRRLLEEPRHRIVLTGYQDEGAPSRALRDLAGHGAGARKVTIANEGGEPIEFNAAMPAKEIGLSAHADGNGLVRYAGQLQPRCIALVHGDAESQSRLQARLALQHTKTEIVTAPSELDVQ